MTNPAHNPLRQTALYTGHLKAGAKMVPFAGWEMPLNYPGGILSEVGAVRKTAGMFDVSHMARLRFSGMGAVPFLDTVLSADVAGLKIGRSKYHVICDEDGGIIDDALVYRIADEECLLVVNAGNADTVVAWLLPQIEAHGFVEMFNYTEQIGMIAVQGPEAAGFLDRLSETPLSLIRPFRIGDATVAGARMRAARTGYTGEDGFELMPPRESMLPVWDALKGAGVEPCGLGARDVLRLEAGFMLHGTDMTRDNDPYEAGLDRFVHIGSPGYVAHDALARIRTQGTKRIMVGFRMIGRGIPRQGQEILRAGEVVGRVTSGTHSPTLDANIGMGYVDRRFSTGSSRFEIDVRGRFIEAEVVPLPFYSAR